VCFIFCLLFCFLSCLITQGFSPFDALGVPDSVFDKATADHGVHAQDHIIRPYVLATRAWRHDNEITSTSNPAIVSTT
jgi:hypothetical protein